MDAFAQTKYILAFTLLACSLAGCTSATQYVKNGFKVGPNYGKPPAAVAKNWIDATDKRIRTDSDDHRKWWTVFNDPVLDSLVCSAYRQNLTLREAGWRIMQARDARNISVGSLFPQTQDAAGGYARNSVSKRAANQQQLPERFYDNSGVGFNLSWELDFWGRYRRAVESANATLDASIEDYDDALVTLLSDTAAAYVQFRTLEQEIVYVRLNVDLQRTAFTLAKARFDGKQTSELDVDQAQSNLSQTEALIPQLEAASRNSVDTLCILLSIPPEDLRVKLGTAPIPTAPPAVAVGVPAGLLTRRPDIRRAERTAAAQSAQIGVAVSELYPHIAITGTLSWQAQRFNDLFTNRALQSTIGPAFQWNILNYGRFANNIRQQDARFQELVATYQKTVIRAGNEVENGLVNFLQSQQQAKKLAESVFAAKNAARIAEVQYKAGAVDFNRVALLQQNLVSQQNLYAQAQGDIAQGLIQTYRALGGGWQIRLDGCDVATVPAAPAKSILPASYSPSPAEQQPLATIAAPVVDSPGSAIATPIIGAPVETGLAAAVLEGPAPK